MTVLNQAELAQSETSRLKMTDKIRQQIRKAEARVLNLKAKQERLLEDPTKLREKRLTISRRNAGGPEAVRELVLVMEAIDGIEAALEGIAAACAEDEEAIRKQQHQLSDLQSDQAKLEAARAAERELAELKQIQADGDKAIRLYSFELQLIHEMILQLRGRLYLTAGNRSLGFAIAEKLGLNLLDIRR